MAEVAETPQDSQRTLLAPKGPAPASPVDRSQRSVQLPSDGYRVELEKLLGEDAKLLTLGNRSGTGLSLSFTEAALPGNEEDRQRVINRMLKKLAAESLRTVQEKMPELREQAARDASAALKEFFQTAASGPLTRLTQGSMQLELGILQQNMPAILEARELLHSNYPEISKLSEPLRKKSVDLIALSDGIWMKYKALRLIDASQRLDSASQEALPAALKQGFEERRDYRRQLRQAVTELDPSMLRGSALEAGERKIRQPPKSMNTWEVALSRSFYSIGRAGSINRLKGVDDLRVAVPTLLPEHRMNSGSDFTDEVIDELPKRISYESRVIYSRLEQTVSLAPAILLRQASLIRGNYDFNSGAAAILLSDMLQPQFWRPGSAPGLEQEFEKKIEEVTQIGKVRVAAEKDPARAQAMVFATAQAVAAERFQFIEGALKKGRVDLSKEGAEAFRHMKEIYAGRDRRDRSINDFLDTVAIDATVGAFTAGVGLTVSGAISISMRRLLVRKLGAEVLEHAGLRAGFWIAERGIEGLAITGASSGLRRLGGDQTAFDYFGQRAAGATLMMFGWRGLQTGITLSLSRAVIRPEEVSAAMRGIEGLTAPEVREVLYRQALSRSIPLRGLNLGAELAGESLFLGLSELATNESIRSSSDPVRWNSVLSTGLLRALELRIAGKISKPLATRFAVGPEPERPPEPIRADLLNSYNAEPPAVAKPFLEGTHLPWYRIALRLPADFVDPLFPALARQMGRPVVLGGGSDLVQLNLGVAKRVVPTRERGVAVGEVNQLVGPSDYFKGFEPEIEVTVPPFKGREGGRVKLSINPESGLDLECWVRNAKDGKPLATGKPASFVPLKDTTLVEVTTDGRATMYFRTPETYSRFLSRKLSLPGADQMTPNEWLGSIPAEERAERVKGTLIYSGVVLARGAPSGWEFEAPSKDFLRSLAQTLNAQQKNEVRRDILERLQHPGANPAPLDFIFNTIGISRNLN